MKYDKAFFHQQLLSRQSIDFVKYEKYKDVDILAELIDSGEISELNEIAWGSFMYHLVDKYENGMGEDRDNMRMVPCDYIETGSSLKNFSDKITCLPSRIKVLVFFRNHTKVIFENVTDGIEVFEHECVRLIHFYTQEVKDDKKLYQELMEIAKDGLYEPLKKSKAELEALQKKYRDLEKENGQLKSNLTTLQKQYDALKASWDNRNKRNKSIHYGIPQELQTDAVQWIIGKLQEKGYIRLLRLNYNDTPIYNWEKSKSLFAYFVERLTSDLELRDTNEQIPWKMFEGAFISDGRLDSLLHNGLKDLVSKYRRSGKIPQNDDVIERILKEAKTKPWLRDATNPK